MRSPGIAAEVLRATFPRQLRYDVESHRLYSDCFALSQQTKHRRYIPIADIAAVLRRYTPLPGPAWLRLPVVRHVLLLPLINVVRHYADKPCWLCAPGAVAEHAKIVQWVAAQQLQAKLQRAGATPRAVEREAFVEQVIKPFRVASLYHRGMRLFAWLVVLALVALVCRVHADTIVYVYLRYVRGMDRCAMLAWFRDITARHAEAHVPPAYASRLPLPCVRYTTDDGRRAYAVNVLELVDARRGVTVMAVPFPRIAPSAFYAHVGELARWCHGLLLECVPLDHLTKLTPAVFLPCKANAMPTVTGVQFSYYDILRNHHNSNNSNNNNKSSSSSSNNAERPPPMLYPGGGRLSWSTALRCMLTPPVVSYVYRPTALLTSSSEARAGWAWLRDVIDGVAAGYITPTSNDDDSSNNKGDDKHATPPQQRRQTSPYVLCVPWTVQQITSIEASLLRNGFTLAHTYRVHWIDEDYLGEHFCDYYHVT